MVRLLLLFALLAAALLLNLCLGEVNLSLPQAFELLSGHAAGSAQQANGALSTMLWEIRLPRLLTACTVGSALAVSGYLLQALSRNYLADPYLTGVSSGAALAVSLIMLSGAGFALLPVGALVGGLAAAILVALLARTSAGLSVTRLLLGGIALSAVCSSFMTLILTSPGVSSHTEGLLFWLAGSVSGRTWTELTPPAVYVLLALLVSFALSKPIRLLALGTETAASLGMNVPKMQMAVLLTAVVLCGSAVSLSGVVGFVGLVAPYVARSSLGNDERTHIAGAAAFGAVMVLISDLCARCMLHGQELPLGTLLSLVGAPFFLWLIIRHREAGVRSAS